MDDITWRKRIEHRARTRRIQDFCIIALFSILLGAWAWYFFVYIRTPEYALHQVQNAIESKNEKVFHQYVNVDLLTSMAYDDLTVDLFSYDKSLTTQEKSLFERFYVLVKPQITNGIVLTIDTCIRTGKEEELSGTDILKGRQLGIDFEHFLERTRLRHTTFVKIGTIDKSGTTAIADIDVMEEYTQTPFTLQVCLNQTSSGGWQISYIKNYKDYLDKVNPLINGDIADYISATQSIVDRYNNLFLKQKAAFATLVKTEKSSFNDTQRESIYNFIHNEVIPANQKRADELAAMDVSGGARYLASLRQKSAELTISAWEHFALGIRKNNNNELQTAETLHKRTLETDQRISNIIKHTAISKFVPNIS
ncbi:MAG: hypothetical protein WCS30_03065 [Selenomonadaceae bacterium]